MKLYKPFAKHLLSELAMRYDRLLTVLPDTTVTSEYVDCSASDLRMAIDDFKTILTELRRLR